MRRTGMAVIVIGVAACNAPAYKDCEITCASGAGCPSGFRCDNQVCRDETAMTPCPSMQQDASTAWSYTPSNAAGDMFQGGTSDWIVTAAVTLDTSTNPPAFTPAAGAPTAMLVTQTDGLEAVVIVVRNLSMQPGSRLTASGRRPLILIANGDATITTIDVGAKGTTPGPSSGFGCTVGSGRQGLFTSTAGHGAGGGGGGSFGSDFGGVRLGASGGTGANESMMAFPGSEEVSMLAPLRGGCSGGAGGDFDTEPGAMAGGGGGAVQISARNALTVMGGGEINAGGGAANSTTANSHGAGGGGSGGGILLEATNLRIDGQLCANGGGGGAAGNTSTHTRAMDGSCAGGGAGGLTGSAMCRGGNGASLALEAAGGGPGTATAVPEGGGGGGGGVGRIRLRGVKTGSGTISPTPST